MQSTPFLSIIIPTHRRAQVLLRALECLDQQTAKGQFEVIVVSDGPDEKTAELLTNTHWSFPLSSFSIPKAQQGAARNAGVKCARGTLCFFIGDDILLSPDACEIHLTAHARHEIAEQGHVAILGFTTWDPSLEVTPTMKWLERTGWQFGYHKIAPYAGIAVPKALQHRFTYTSHLSLPRKIALKVPFREDVALYGWEDIEWGLRLKNVGIPLFYEPTAKATHYHRITLEESLQRMETLGRSIVHLTALAPGLDRIPQGWKWWGYQAASLLPTFRGMHSKAFLQGIHSARVNTASTCTART